MKTITLLGQELNIAFNMAVQIAYEKITDKAFDLTDMVKAESRMALYYAIIITNNPDTSITMDQMLRESTVDDIKAIDTACNAAISEWYHIPLPAEEPEEKSDEEKKNV